MTEDPQLPPILHLGAEHGVTGSCHLLRTHGLNILIDCGSAQGGDTAASLESWPVAPSEVDYLFITHAHIDHTGRIPELLQNGFRGEILTTHATRILLMPMLEDAMSFAHLSDAEIDDLSRRIGELTWGFEVDEEFDLKNGLRFKFRRAGHILGSSFVRIASADPPWSVIFSGDIGAKGKPLLPDPDPPDPCDLLIMESTYGDTVHEDRSNRIEKLGAVFARALADGGKVYIPSLALGRTQEIIHDMDRLAHVPELRKRYPVLKPEARIPVFLDSPLGIRLTQIYRLLHPYWDLEARRILRSGNDPLDLEQLYTAARFEEHLEILQMDGPCIIIAGSGMCTGGRIIDHLKAGIGDPRNDIVFVGYQGEGTTGREIIEQGQRDDGEGVVMLDGEPYPVRAKIHVLTGYSGHADQNELVEWVQSMPEPPRRIKLIHGDLPARKALAERLQSMGYAVETAH